VSEVYGERFDLTLWETARLVLEAGGEISRGEFGEPRLALPELVQREPMLERDARAPPVSAAEALCSAHALDGRSQPFCQLELPRRRTALPRAFVRPQHWPAGNRLRAGLRCKQSTPWSLARSRY
jgi:hypothetical protein